MRSAAREFNRLSKAACLHYRCSTGPSMATKPNNALAKARRKRRTLSGVVAAEARLDAGTFGLCEACGRSISLDRLRTAPTARRCKRCQSRRRAS